MRDGTRMLLAWAVLLLAVSCEEPAEFDVTLHEELRHADGLVVRRPDRYHVIESVEGIAFQEDGNIRSARHVRVTRRTRAPSIAPEGSRDLPGGATARYAMETGEGGSGGTEYKLTVWRPAGDAWIVVSETAQAELGEPGFFVAWALIDQARIEGADE